MSVEGMGKCVGVCGPGKVRKDAGRGKEKCGWCGDV